MCIYANIDSLRHKIKEFLLDKGLKCIPRESIVKIGENIPGNFLYYPPCIFANRCGGCCSPISLKKCEGTANETLYANVFKIWADGSKYIYYMYNVALSSSCGCACARVHLCMCAFVRVCAHVCGRVCTCACVCLHVRVCTYACVRTCARVCVCVCVCVRERVCACVR